MIEKTKRVFKYDELNENAKEVVRKKVKKNIIDIYNYCYSEELSYLINVLFPSSIIKYQYRLLSPYEDWFNIQGMVCLKDVLSILERNSIDLQEEKLSTTFFTDDEINILYKYNSLSTFEIPLLQYEPEYSPSFMLKNFKDEFYSEYVTSLKEFGIQNINYELIHRVISIFYTKIEEIERVMLQYGYKCIEVTEEDITDYCESNNLTFTENGYSL